jgi:hypothetical protein
MFSGADNEPEAGAQSEPEDGLQPKPSLAEHGSSGMTYTAGSGIGYGGDGRAALGRVINQEYNKDLTGKRGLEQWERMRRSDPKVHGLLRALDLPLVHAEWVVEPANVGDARSEEIAEFVAKCLFEDMDKTWVDTLTEILLYADYGYSVFEKVWKIEEQKVKLKHFGWLPPQTINDIFVKNRKCEAVEQWTNEKGRVTIPGKKLIWFINRKEGDNFYGIPVLRPMWKPWFNKERAEILLLILAERMGGWLKFNSPPGATPQDIAAANQIGRDFRVNEAMYMILPPGWEAVVESATDVTLADLLAFIKHENEEISAAALAQVLDLGVSESGSRALGRTLGDMFMEFEQGRAEYVEGVFNDDIGVISELVSYNFPDWKEHVPKLKCGSVSELDIKNFAIAIKTLSDAGMPFAGETWEWIRQQADLPEEEELDKKATEDALKPPEPPPPPFGQQDPNDPQKKRGEGPWIPPGEGDYNPSPDEVEEEPED